jgi:oligoribonuclease
MGKNHIVWMDLEMTGLDPAKDKIIEIATIVTDAELEILEKGPCFIIGQPASAFDQMDQWNREHHTKSGLWQKVIESTVTIEEAEKETIDFLKKFVKQGKSPLAGNSIWQDRRFIAAHMPNLDQFLHYRLIDVSTLKELSKRWYPKVKPWEKQNSHRALDDIEESINELKHYRETLFIKNQE